MIIYTLSDKNKILFTQAYHPLMMLALAVFFLTFLYKESKIQLLGYSRA